MSIYIALGANLPSTVGEPQTTLEHAIARMPDHGITVTARAPLYTSPAFPPSDQPDFLNTVIEVATELAPDDLMATLLEIEQGFGRIRKQKWEARPLDLDLLDYNGEVRAGSTVTDLSLPHPRIAERTFVLKPLAAIAPNWVHPITGAKIADLLAARTDLGSVRDRTDD